MTLRWAVIAAYVNAAAALAQLLTSAGDVRTSAGLGLANNLAGVVWAASFVPLAWAFYRASRTHTWVVSAAALAVGIVAMAGSAGLELATASGRLTFDQEMVAYYPVFGALGVWLLMSEALVVLDSDWEKRPLIFGMTIGFLWFAANLLFGAGGFPLGDQQTPTNDATDFGIVLLGMTFYLQPFWGLWLGRSLRQRLAASPSQRLREGRDS